MRIQSYPDILQEIKGKEVYWSIKMDGTSSSFMNIEGDIHVCSRNLSLKETEGNTYWKIFRKYDLEKVLKDAGSFSIMGEIVGPSIQKNPVGLKDHELFVFSIYDIKGGKFLDFSDFKNFCTKYNLTTVPIDRTGIFSFNTVDELVEEATKVKYANGSKAEGYVIRPVVECYSQVLSGRLSVKVINNNYLLAEKD
jgi:RNA ligase (TIGR02306 family)